MGKNSSSPICASSHFRAVQEFNETFYMPIPQALLKGGEMDSLEPFLEKASMEPAKWMMFLISLSRNPVFF